MKHTSYQTHDVNTHVEVIGGYYVNQEASTTLLQRDMIVEVQPITSVQSGFIQTNSASYVNVDLKGFDADYVDEMLIKYTVTNTSADVGTTNLVPAPLLIERVDVMYSGEIVESIYGEALWIDSLAYYPYETLSRLSVVNGYDPDTFLSNNSFGPGDSRTYYIPVSSIITGANIAFCCEQSNKFQLRIYVAGGSQLIEDPMAPHTIADFESSDLSIILSCVILDPETRQMKQSMLYERPYDYKFLEHRIFNISSGDITALTQYQQTVQQQGDLSHIFVMLRPAAPTGAEIYSPLAISQFDFWDSSGRSLLATATNTITEDLLKYVLSTHYYDGDVFGNLNIYPLTWNGSPAKTMVTQSNYGSLQLTGNERFVFTPTDTTANTEIVLLTYFYSMLSINHANGKHKLYRSS